MAIPYSDIYGNFTFGPLGSGFLTPLPEHVIVKGVERLSEIIDDLCIKKLEAMNKFNVTIRVVCPAAKDVDKEHYNGPTINLLASVSEAQFNANGLSDLMYYLPDHIYKAFSAMIKGKDNRIEIMQGITSYSCYRHPKTKDEPKKMGYTNSEESQNQKVKKYIIETWSSDKTGADYMEWAAFVADRFGVSLAYVDGFICVYGKACKWREDETLTPDQFKNNIELDIRQFTKQDTINLGVVEPLHEPEIHSATVEGEEVSVKCEGHCPCPSECLVARSCLASKLQDYVRIAKLTGDPLFKDRLPQSCGGHCPIKRKCDHAGYCLSEFPKGNPVHVSGLMCGDKCISPFKCSTSVCRK
jgi:hypothetical protein